MVGGMMKRIVIIVLLLAFSFGIHAEPVYHVNLPHGVAFINRNGDVVIDAIGSFLDGYAWGLNTEFNGIGIAVLSDKRDNKYHLLTSDGEWLYASEKVLVPASYTRVWEQVSETVWRLINFDGEEYYKIDLGQDFSITRRDLGYFVEGKAVVTDNTGSKVISENGDVVAMFPYRQNSGLWYYPGEYLDSGIFVGTNGNLMENSLQFAVLSIDGKVIYGPASANNVWPVGPPSEGKVFMRPGYVDTNGNRGKDGSGYFYGHHYTEGLAAVIMPGRKDPDHFYAYYINHDGEIVIDGEKLGLTDARPFSDGLAAVSTRPPVPTSNIRKAMDIFNDNPFTSHLYKEGKWGAIDKTGKWVIKPKFPDPFRFDRGLALLKFDYSYTTDSMVKMNLKPLTTSRYVYIDKKGKVVYDSFKTAIEQFTSSVKTWRVVDPGFVIE
jgi:hypothetical protein